MVVLVSAASYLTGRDELQRAESDLEVGSVGLEIVESASNAGLQLGGVLAGRAVHRDLVELGGTHVGGWVDCRSIVESFDWRSRRWAGGLGRKESQSIFAQSPRVCKPWKFWCQGWPVLVSDFGRGGVAGRIPDC